MKSQLLLALAAALVLSSSCNGSRIGSDDPDDGGSGGVTDLVGCVGLACSINESMCSNATPTTLSGVVSIPSGTLPLYNAKVYIPTDPDPAHLPAVTTGVNLSSGSCDRCDATIPGNVIASAVTDLNGRFSLSPVPVGVAFPVVIRVGKWRRVVMVDPIAAACTTTTLAAEQTRLPRNQREGNIPKMALTTGTWDALECLLRSPKLGLDAAEFTNPGGSGRVNLYSGNGTDRYAAGVNGGAGFPAADPWWDSAQHLAAYDIVMHSCQGTPSFLGSNATAAHTALETYIGKGGRVFASHWHNVWISRANPSSLLPTVASFLYDPSGTAGYTGPNTPVDATINQSFEKGKSLAQWLVNANPPGTLRLGQLPIKNSRVTLISRNAELTTDWADFADPSSHTDGVAASASQYFSFNAPVGAPDAAVCGKMVFTDMHVSGSSGDPTVDQSVPGTGAGKTPFPTGCKTTALTPQEQALLFLIFDLTSCVAPIVG